MARKTAAAAPTATDDEQHPRESEWESFDSIRPWHYNPNEGDVEGIMESLKTYGWGRPLVANRYPGLEGELIIGHHTLEAARRLDAAGEVIPGAPRGKAPVRWVSLPEKKAHGLALADNQRAKKGKVSEAKLRRVVELGELGPEEWMGAGFTEKEIKALMFDAWPSPEDEAQVEHQYSVIIDCRSEEEQVQVLEWCQQKELKCRALI